MKEIVKNFINHKKITSSSTTLNTSESYQRDLKIFLDFLFINKINSFTKINKSIIEHKINGRIDSIEIKPIIGQTYYLIDNDDRLRKGANQSREQNEILSNWRLLKW